MNKQITPRIEALIAKRKSTGTRIAPTVETVDTPVQGERTPLESGLDGLDSTRQARSQPPQHRDQTVQRKPTPPPPPAAEADPSILTKGREHAPYPPSKPSIPQTPPPAAEVEDTLVELPAKVIKRVEHFGWRDQVPALGLTHPREVGPAQYHPDAPILGLTKIGAATSLETWTGPIDSILAVAGNGWERWERTGPQHRLDTVCTQARPKRIPTTTHHHHPTKERR